MLKHYFLLILGILLISPFSGAQQPPDNKKTMPVEKMISAILADPDLAGSNFFYDKDFKALGSFAVHDHIAKRICMGYLVSDGKRLAYRYVTAFPLVGSSDDTFETDLSNMARVEYKSYTASKGVMDFYPERLSVKFFFKTPIVGSKAKWEKKDFKVDIWDVSFGNRLMEFVKAAGVPTAVRD